MFDKTRLSCIVGSVENQHPRTFAYYSDDNIEAAGYFGTTAEFRPGDKIIAISITEGVDSITRTEKPYVLDFIGGQWKVFATDIPTSDNIIFDGENLKVLTGITVKSALSELDAAVSALQDSVSILQTDVELADTFGHSTEILLDELNAIDIDGRPSYKAAGATVYGPNNTIGIIGSVKDLSVMVYTVSAPTNMATLTRFGATMDSLLAATADDGTLNNSRVLGDIDMSGVITIGKNALAYKFANNRGTGTFNAPDLTTIQDYGCRGIFSNATGLTSVNVPKLANAAIMAFANAFENCTGLTSLSFPMLVFMNSQVFGADESTYAFTNCPNLVEIHFRKDAQKYVEALVGYTDKWGATNAQIIFDL